MAVHSILSLRLLSRARSALGSTGLLALLFVALTLLDLLLTAMLLGTPGECFYEANPVADAVLHTAGWLGLGFYKLASAALVLGAVALLARRHAPAARGVLAVACPVVGAVVGYSLFLIVANGADRRALHEASDKAAELDIAFQEQQAFLGKAWTLARDLTAHRVGLSEAARELDNYRATLYHNVLGPWRRLFPGLSHRALLAVVLVREVGFLLQDNPSIPNTLRCLRADFASAFGLPLPSDATAPFVGPHWQNNGPRGSS